MVPVTNVAGFEDRDQCRTVRCQLTVQTSRQATSGTGDALHPDRQSASALFLTDPTRLPLVSTAKVMDPHVAGGGQCMPSDVYVRMCASGGAHRQAAT
jgi:hypothetical protein